ncbi:MAG: hypothetical protein U0441_07845 [Polyangiaceae bacterium]
MAERREPPSDPNVEIALRLVNESLARLRPELPPEALARLRELLEDFALTHPEMRKMVDRLRPRPVAEASELLQKDGEAEREESDAPARGRKAG